MKDLRRTTKQYIEIPMKSIYVVENERGTVKIGISQRPESRVNTLSKQGGFKVINLYTTKPCSNAYQLEAEIHKQLQSIRINGEWFAITFKEATIIVSYIFKTKAQYQVKKQRCMTPDDIADAFRAI